MLIGVVLIGVDRCCWDCRVSLLKGLLTIIVTTIFCSTSHTRTTNFPLVPKSMTFSHVKDLFF